MLYNYTSIPYLEYCIMQYYDRMINRIVMGRTKSKWLAAAPPAACASACVRCVPTEQHAGLAAAADDGGALPAAHSALATHPTSH